MKNRESENYLERIPVRKAEIAWSVDEIGNVVLEMENKGIVNRIAQKLLGKPKISYIHLDRMGSFIWPLLDGQTNIIQIGDKVKEEFGDESNPLYERLIKFILILENNRFIDWQK